MAWSKSLNNKFAKIQPKEEEKKQESSFYDNYKARSGSNNNSVSFTPSLKAKTGGSTGSAASSKQSGGGTVSSKKAAPTTVLGNNTKYFSGFQSYQDRKKTGNVFTPSPVLGKYGSGFNFGTTLKLKAENNKRKQERERLERGVYHPNTRITSGNIATFSAPIMSEVIPGITKDLEKELGSLMLDYKNIAESQIDTFDKNNRIHQLITDKKYLFDEYKRQKGYDMTIPDLEYMYEKYSKEITKKMQKESEDKNVRTATPIDLTWNSFTRGINEAIYGEESYKAMGGQYNNAGQYKELLEQDKYRFKPKSRMGRGISALSETLGREFKNIFSPETALAVGSAVSLAAAAGQAGPQAALPEEVITIPGAAIIGLKSGSIVNALKTEAGLAYASMIDNGITPETAYKVAFGVGSVNAALDAISMDDLLKAFKVVGRLKGVDKISNEMVKYMLKKGVDISVDTTKDLLGETAGIVGEQGASMYDKGEWAYNSDEVKDILKNAALDNIFSSMLDMRDMWDSNSGHFKFRPREINR